MYKTSKDVKIHDKSYLIPTLQNNFYVKIKKITVITELPKVIYINFSLYPEEYQPSYFRNVLPEMDTTMYIEFEDGNMLVYKKYRLPRFVPLVNGLKLLC